MFWLWNSSVELHFPIHSQFSLCLFFLLRIPQIKSDCFNTFPGHNLNSFESSSFVHALQLSWSSSSPLVSKLVNWPLHLRDWLQFCPVDSCHSGFNQSGSYFRTLPLHSILPSNWLIFNFIRSLSPLKHQRRPRSLTFVKTSNKTDMHTVWTLLICLILINQ